MLRICRIRLQLLAQLQDLIIHGTRSRIEVISPNLIQQQIACKDTLGIFGKKFQKLELVSGEDNRLPVALDGHFFEVDFTFSKAIDRRWRRLALSADGCLNAGCELSWAKGLGDVVVGPQFKKQHLIRDFRDRAEHYDRSLRG